MNYVVAASSILASTISIARPFWMPVAPRSVFWWPDMVSGLSSVVFVLAFALWQSGDKTAALRVALERPMNYVVAASIVMISVISVARLFWIPTAPRLFVWWLDLVSGLSGGIVLAHIIWQNQMAAFGGALLLLSLAIAIWD
jgi:hypothetical protein